MQEKKTRPQRAREKPRSRLSRRDFLKSLSTLLAGGLLAGCVGLEQQKQQRELSRWGTPTRPAVLASPAPPLTEAAAAQATPEAEGGLDLAGFMALSSVLTGFDNLNLNLGRVYLESLQARTDFDISLETLYEQAGFSDDSPPQVIEEVVERGIFDQEETRSLADTIVEYWYTGVYTRDDQEVVATTVDALAWQSLTFTKPPTVCGPYPGFWAEVPVIEPVPPVHAASLADESADQ